MSSDPSLNTDPLPNELLELASMTSGAEAARYLRKYRELTGEPEPEPPPSIHVFDESTPFTLDTFNEIQEILNGREISRSRERFGIPCPRCGAIVDRRSPQGRREEWECNSCGFGFDLPTTE